MKPFRLSKFVKVPQNPDSLPLFAFFSSQTHSLTITTYWVPAVIQTPAGDLEKNCCMWFLKEVFPSAQTVYFAMALQYKHSVGFWQCYWTSYLNKNEPPVSSVMFFFFISVSIAVSSFLCHFCRLWIKTVARTGTEQSRMEEKAKFPQILCKLNQSSKSWLKHYVFLTVTLL